MFTKNQKLIYHVPATGMKGIPLTPAHDIPVTFVREDDRGRDNVVIVSNGQNLLWVTVDKLSERV